MSSTLSGRRGLRAAALLALFLTVTAACTSPATSVTGTPIASAPASKTPMPSASGTLEPPASASLEPAPYETAKPVAYTPPPPPTPTPSPREGMWRWEGVIVDGSGAPIADVCVAVGPHGCLPTSTRSDQRGVWFIDFPRAHVDYDLHFMKEGYRTYDVRVTPVSSNTFNVVLEKG